MYRGLAALGMFMYLGLDALGTFCETYVFILDLSQHSALCSLLALSQHFLKFSLSPRHVLLFRNILITAIWFL